MDYNIILGKSTLTNVSDAYSGTLNVSYSQYTNNGVYLCKIDTTNTTISPTLSLNGLTAYPIKRNDGTSILIGELKVDAWYLFMFDQSTSTFEILNLSIPYFNGTTNYVAKYTPTGNVLGISQIFDNGTNVGIGTVTPTSKLQIVGSNSTSSNYSLKIDNSANSPLLYVRNDGNVGIGISTPNARLDILGDITGNLLKINNNNFIFSDKLRIENNGSFHSGSINAFGAFGIGDFTTNHLNYTLNTGFSTYLAFTNNGNISNISSYGIIGGNISSVDKNFKLTILNSDNSLSNGIKILCTGSGVSNDGFNYYNYGLNIINSGTQTNSGSGNFYKIGLNVDVNNGDINYAALFNGGNVGIGTSTPSEKLEVNGNIKTAQPSANGAGAWKLGKKVTATVSLVTTDYIEVEIDSVVYKLALVS